MGIIVRERKEYGNGKLMFYLKGAEVVMKQKVKNAQKTVVDERVDGLA
jgi:hypothetical protein